MVIDLSGDESEQDAPNNKPARFEEEHDEIDPSRPYLDVIKYLDIPLGTAVMHIATPHVPANLDYASTDAYPALFNGHMALVVACSDFSIHLLSLPLQPPAPTVTSAEKAGLNSVRIYGPNSHQDLITSIVVTHSADVAESEKSRSRSRGQVADTSEQDNVEAKAWSLLVASTSCTGSGLLLVHKVPLTHGSAFSTDAQHLPPLQRQYLRTSLLRCKLSFNSASFPAERHSNLLLALPEAGCVKIYQVFPPATSGRGRRGSAATGESSSTPHSARVASGHNGRLLLTLYPAFAPQGDLDACFRRKKVLDASWVLDGRAIITLLGDGEWGIWDIEGAGPASTNAASNLLRSQTNVSGIQGGSLSKFAISSSVAAKDSARRPPSSKARSTQPHELAPMTPHTRRVRSEDLFQGQGQQSDISSRQEAASIRGAVYVFEHPPSSSHSAMKHINESVVLTYGTTNTLIPNITSFWRSQIAGRGSFDTASDSRSIVLPTLRLGGEMQHSLALLEGSFPTKTGLFSSNGGIPNFLIATDTRILLSMAPVYEPTIMRSTTESSFSNSNKDQALLTSGDLDVDGMDRILDDMTTSATKPHGLSVFGKSVGFQLDDDVDMNAPPPSYHSKLHVGRTNGEPRRLFS